MLGTARRAVRRFANDSARPTPRAAGKLGRALPNYRFPICEDIRYGRGAGVARDRGTDVALGVVVAVDVGVAVGVAVELAVAVGVAVGVAEPDGAQYLPPVLK
jgi:hypothetical protein